MENSVKTYVHRLGLIALALLCARSADARNGSLYLMLEPAWGFYFSDEVVIDKDPSSKQIFPEAGFTPQLKLGVNLFGFGGAEADIAVFGWDLDSAQRGGGGFVGGDVRITPLEFLTFVIPPTVEIPSLMPPGPVNWHNRPFDIGIYMGGGWGIVGEDYAYQGGYFKWGFDLQFYVTPQLAVGIDLPFRHPFYKPFRYVDYNNSSGFCTDHEQGFGFAANGDRVDVQPTTARNTYRDFEVSSDDANDLCDEPAPGAMFFAPALTISGVFDFGI
jgi:hypothetical protein